MDEMKIKNYTASHPQASFPDFRSLAVDECRSLITKLISKLGIAADSSGLAILRSLEKLARDVPAVQPSELTFSPMPLLLRMQSEPRVYLNWNRFEHIDEMSADDFVSLFHDLWYPSSDDIEVFDNTLNWVLMIRHFDVVQTVQFRGR